MQSGWRIGSLFGIPFYIDLSWFVILFLIALPTASNWQLRYPEWSVSTVYLSAFAMALLFFGSVLLHELGHSLVALSQGIKVTSIKLFLFGGVASIERESKTPGKAFQVAIAGPAVSLVLALLLALFANVSPGVNTPINVIAQYLATTNLILALFNLLPGLPLDGGQVVKAAVWKATGSRFKGVRWAARAGSVLGWSAIALGGFSLLSGASNGLWFMLLGWFGIQNAGGYDRMTEMQETLLSLKASDAMTREFRVVDANMTLREFADKYLLLAAQPEVYFASSDGRYRGLVASDDLQSVERSRWERETLAPIIHPLDTIATVEEATPLATVIQQLETDASRRMTVLSPAGAVSGVIDRGDIVRALTQKLKMPITDSLIKQIKEDGTYPPGFQIAALAQSAIEAAEK
ncbi:site-2 protease family protein [Phormidium sp. CLA17]|uniref:site-2 protease family protein n=1 Tax=Leptolyngbya sp. Cla-17 TaxID=2803751 RepID=UPI001491E9FA|nr:site-2 protease family protein [Leptolyngbya sp. Cla-17]MBM0741250.1 site-2 protease family protein [Leptolyngbya sp. Cla-17]